MGGAGGAGGTAGDCANVTPFNAVVIKKTDVKMSEREVVIKNPLSKGPELVMLCESTTPFVQDWVQFLRLLFLFSACIVTICKVRP